MHLINEAFHISKVIKNWSRFKIPWMSGLSFPTVFFLCCLFRVETKLWIFPQKMSSPSLASSPKNWRNTFWKISQKFLVTFDQEVKIAFYMKYYIQQNLGDPLSQLVESTQRFLWLINSTLEKTTWHISCEMKIQIRFQNPMYRNADWRWNWLKNKGSGHSVFQLYCITSDFLSSQSWNLPVCPPSEVL